MESPLTSTPAGFIKTQDLADPKTMSVYAMCEAVSECIGCEELIGCQQIGKIWRVYARSTDSRVKLLTNNTLANHSGCLMAHRLLAGFTGCLLVYFKGPHSKKLNYLCEGLFFTVLNMTFS